MARVNLKKDDVITKILINIKVHVHGAKRGEHHVRITSKTNIDGMRFDNGRHIISICLATTMFGDTYYIGGRVK